MQTGRIGRSRTWTGRARCRARTASWSSTSLGRRASSGWPSRCTTQRRFEWDEFRDRLIAEIAAADQQGVESDYYERWLDAFERLLVDKGMLTREELAARLADFESGSRDDVF